MSARRRRRGLDLGRSGGFIGIAGLACVLFLDLASVPLFAWWANTLLLALWLLLLLTAFATFTPRPRLTMVLPLVGFLAWLAAVLVVNA